MNAATPSPKAEKINNTFSMSCAVTVNIRAPADRVWSVLTNAQAFPKWNSTVTSIGGTIALGQKLEIRVPAAPSRTFKPRVTTFEPAKSMVWSDGMPPMFTGARTYTLATKADGSTDFTMSEVFAGLMLPIIKGSMPDFGPIFEAYANDLKREAERSPS